MAAFDVVIVGAGIVGSACARECVRAGFRVAIVEGGVPAGGATAAGMGHVVVMDDSPAQLALTTYSRGLWNAELPELPRTVEYEARGTIWVAADDEEMVEVHAKQATYERVGVCAEVLDSTDLATQEPNLRSGLAGGLLVPDDGVIYPPAAAQFYLSEARRLGAEFHLSRAISAANGVVLLADGTRLTAPHIVLAWGQNAICCRPFRSRSGKVTSSSRIATRIFCTINWSN